MVWQTGHLLNNGKYEILEVLGRGGFGLTYKARHQQLAMEVVIKTPDILQKRDTEYEDYVKQFKAEGRKLAKFSQTLHPHIVRVWDIFIEGQVPCLVMDFIQGQTLMEKVKAQGKLSEAECLKYIRQIGSALEEVHQAGMVHRDAHPGNIMIQPNGNAILIDFGIAKEIIPASSSSTNSGANFSFAPYEQIYSGKPNRQPSVDIYTLAASFYYAVTGEKPTPSMERRLEDRPLKSAKEINRNLSDHLNTAITQGMALEKGDRPQSMSDWLQQLELPHLSEHLNTAITLGMALEKENRPQSMSDWLQQLELPPPAVEPQYRQETVNPSRSVKPEKRPEVAKQKPKINRRSAQNSIQEKLKNIPWGLLIGVFFLYIMVGYILYLSSAPWWAVVVALAVALAGVVAGFGVVAAAAAGALVAVGTINMAVHTAVHGVKTSVINVDGDEVFVEFLYGYEAAVRTAVPIGFVALIVALIVAAAVTETEKKLLKYFSRFHSFLILSVTNLSGLGSGWLLGFLLYPKG